MAFQSGITTSPNDLLDKIRLFATTYCAYTQLMYQADAGYYRLHLQHAGSGQYVNLHSYASYIAGTARPVSAAAWPTARKPYRFGLDLRASCRAVPSTSCSAATAGAIASCRHQHHLQHAHLRHDHQDLQLHRWCLPVGHLQWCRAGRHRQATPMQVENRQRLRQRTSSRMFYTSLTRQLDSYSPITFNGVTPLYPMHGRSRTHRRPPTLLDDGLRIPGVRLLRMNGQYANKDIVTLGGDDWMVFQHELRRLRLPEMTSYAGAILPSGRAGRSRLWPEYKFLPAPLTCRMKVPLQQFAEAGLPDQPSAGQPRS
jgi:hypothetical protein